MKKLLTLGIVLLTLLIAVPVIADPGTQYVDDDGPCGGNTPCYSTIQAAINAASDGDTVIVLPGTYGEQLTVNKDNLTIRSFDGSAVDGSADTIISPPESTPGGVIIIGDGNALQGFKIVDETNHTHTHRLVKLEGDNNQVLNNWIIGRECPAYEEGVLVRGESTTGDGIADGNLVENNEVEKSCIGINSVSVASSRRARGTIVRSNNTHDNVWIGVSVDRSPDSLVEGNTVGPNNNSYAIYCQARETTQGSWASSAGSIIQDNVAQGNPEGARFEACGGVSVSCNTFAGNTIGIRLSVEAGNTGTPTINFNTISGNGTGIQNDTAETVNAENNWWDDASGPTHASNPGGSGDPASDYVDFDPWLSTPIGDICPPPPVIEVDIDIKPGSDPNSINPQNKGKIPVAILSTSDFDAPNEVDWDSLTFGHTGEEESLAFCSSSPEDVNNDGYDDLICHFDTQSAGFECGDEWGYLKGQTGDSVPIEGSDSVKIVPCEE